MTPRTPQCEVFCPLLSSSEPSGVLEDSKSPTFPSVGLHPTLGQVRVATKMVPIMQGAKTPHDHILDVNENFKAEVKEPKCFTTLVLSKL